MIREKKRAARAAEPRHTCWTWTASARTTWDTADMAEKPKGNERLERATGGKEDEMRSEKKRNGEARIDLAPAARVR
ncbi:hypothetical protein SCP_0107700 [Sparassis crispa]|uniref:Uncharacterized protein n=1 Tax=Sparassis crispa TaxID=139825 RepID=A0A401G6V5_9APHY|nr:hypothetical protein SCP_0107700 [Sparassis crispa]GBE77888.1 hypothetical protein SCP_0107700 [Sparassis crispa]